MRKPLRKFLGLLLAAVMLLTTLPVTSLAINDVTVHSQTLNAFAGNSLLRIDIATSKNSYTLLSTINFSVTITNTSSEVISNVSAEALFGKDLKPLANGSQITAEKASLNPAESLNFNYNAEVKNLKWLDILLFPIKLISSLFKGSAITLRDNGFNDGRELEQASKDAKLLSLFSSSYDASTTVKVYYGDGEFPNPEPDNSTITRGQWTQRLVNKMGLDLISDLSDFNCFYADSADSQYGVAIETAQVYGLLPPPDSAGYVDPEQDIALFRPDEIAAREFSAYTAVNAIGFYGETDLLCADSASIKYPDEVAIAISEMLFLLDGGKFIPAGPVIGTDWNRFVIQYDSWQAFSTIDESDYHCDIQYTQGVIDLGGISSYTINQSGNTYTVTLPKNSTTAAIAPGTIIVLPENASMPSGIAIKVSTVNNSGSNCIVTGVQAEMGEVFNYVSFTGEAAFDPNGIEVEDGVTVEYIPPANSSGMQAQALDLTASASAKFTFAEKEIGKHTTVSGSVEFTPKAQIKLDGGLKWDWIPFEITEFVFKLQEEAKLNIGVEVKGTPASPTSGKIRLGKIPFALGPTGAFLNVNVYLKVEITGEASIEFSFSGTQGFSYKKGHKLVNLTKIDTGVDFLKLEAKVKVGAETEARFEWIGFAFLEIKLGAGLKLEGSLKPLSAKNCLDVKLSAFLEAKADEGENLFAKTVRKFKLELKAEAAFPLGSWHFESFKRIARCTDGMGSLHGLVKDKASDNTIKNARAEIYQGLVLVKTVYSNSNGQFVVNDLPGGSYTIRISATGYKTYTTFAAVGNGVPTYLETQLLVDRNNSGNNGTALGNVTDAITGGKLLDVAYRVRADWNNTSGSTLVSGTEDVGVYVISLAPGNYTIEFSKPGYITTFVNVAVTAGRETVMHVSLPPVGSGDQFRIVLTWGTDPRDLDSHLEGPGFHVYYQNKSSGDGTALLDVDETNGFGPETVTLTASPTATYNYYVHHYAGSGSIGTSSAQVRVYQGGTLIATYNAPMNITGGVGSVWNVFRIVNGQLQASSNVGAQAAVQAQNVMPDWPPKEA